MYSQIASCVNWGPFPGGLCQGLIRDQGCHDHSLTAHFSGTIPAGLSSTHTAWPLHGPNHSGPLALWLPGPLARDEGVGGESKQSYSSSSFLAFHTLAVVVFPPPKPSLQLQLQISLDLATAPLLLARASNAGISLILKALRNFDNFCWFSLMLPNHPPHLGASFPCFLKEPWLIEDPTDPNIDQGEKGWSRTNLIFEMIHNSTGYWVFELVGNLPL